jgi:hypothetical protein
LDQGIFTILFLLVFLSATTSLRAQVHPTPLVSCAISGSTTATYGSTVTYTLDCSTGSATNWSCTCGTITAETSTSVTIEYNDIGCSSAVITAIGTTATKTVTITGVPVALNGGTISNPSQSIDYDTVPAEIIASAASGGSCSGSYSYQWYSSTNNSTFTAISGATGQDYQPGVLTVTTYFKRLTTCGSSTAYTTNTATVTVYSQLTGGTISPASESINYNTSPGTLTLSGVSGGNGTYSYQWLSSTNDNSFSTISGATSTTYTPPALTTTTYYVVNVYSNGIIVNSSVATITVYGALAGGSISPSAQTINYNTTPSVMTLNGVSGGNGTYTYQWQSSPNNSTWSNASGTSTTYTPGALTATTYYRVRVISNGDTAYSSSAEITVYPVLQGGTISPASQTINYDATPSTLTLSGVSGGSGTYTYQWQSSPDNSTWTNIGSATSSSYTPGALTATTYYRVVVTSNGGTANSTSATVTVYPAIQGGTISPASQGINYNTTPSTLTLSGVSGGNGTYTYQWQSSPDNSTWTNISGATTTTYSPGALTATTYYRVVVTSNGATTSSASATVTVYPTLQSGSISPSSQAINYNTAPSTLTSSGVSGGSGTYTYQWQSSPDNSTWTNITGATSSSYSPGALTATTYYRLVVTSNGVSANSASATVTVYTALQVGSISPSTQTISYNTTPSALTVGGISGGSGSYTYQWQSSPDNSTWTNISAATSATYAPGALTATTYYQVIVTSNGASVTSSNSAVVNVCPALLGGSISPSTQTINYGTAGSALTLSGVSGGCSGYTYQWQSSPNDATWTNITGQTGTSFTPASQTATTYYQVVITSGSSTANSSAATISVYPQLQSGSITSPSQSINYNTTPSPLTASGASGGSGTYTYQWQSSTNNSTWTNISGATSSTYSPGALTTSTYYQLVVTSNGVSATTGSVEITVYPALQAGTISPASQSIPSNTTPSSLSLTGVSGGNGSYSYVWQASTDDVNWSNAGSTTTSFSPGTLTANTYYRVAVTSNGQTLYSGIASVTSSLSAGVISGPGSPIGYGTSPGTLGSSQPAGGGTCTNYSYQWQYSLNGSTWYNLPNATGASYSSTPLTTSIYFRRQVTCSGATATSNALYVQVNSQSQSTSCPIGQQ